MAIRVLSFDFDGCLFNKNYILSENKDVIAHNLLFLNTVKSENSEFSHVIGFVGSNRQSMRTDQMNWSRKGSCFPAIKKICEYLEITLDTFLIADIFGHLSDGTSYQQAIDETFDGKHSDWQVDDTKLTILYAQMQKIANQYPGEEIVFDFYDDRRYRPATRFTKQSDDLLEHLSKVFKTHPELMPLNVTLRLNHYNGAQTSLVSQIQGTGMIDANYRETVIEMTDETIKLEFETDIDIKTEIHAAHYVTPEVLKNRATHVGQITSTFSHSNMLFKPADEDDRVLPSKTAESVLN